MCRPPPSPQGIYPKPGSPPQRKSSNPRCDEALKNPACLGAKRGHFLLMVDHRALPFVAPGPPEGRDRNLHRKFWNKDQAAPLPSPAPLPPLDPPKPPPPGPHGVGAGRGRSASSTGAAACGCFSSAAAAGSAARPPPPPPHPSHSPSGNRPNIRLTPSQPQPDS